MFVSDVYMQIGGTAYSQGYKWIIFFKEKIVLLCEKPAILWKQWFTILDLL